jgi:vacuolar protein-sorting-associated protein 4
VQVHLGDMPRDLSEADFEALGRHTKGLSGSDIEVMVNEVLMQPIRLIHEATHFR